MHAQVEESADEDSSLTTSTGLQLEVLDDETLAPQTVKRVTLFWPVVLAYPEHMQTDFIQVLIRVQVANELCDFND